MAYITDVLRSRCVHVCTAALIFRLFVSQGIIVGEALVGLYRIGHNNMHHLI